MSYPIKTKRSDDDSARARKVLGYKDGGAVKRHEDSGTNIHISIGSNLPKPGGMGMPPPDPGALASALAQSAQPPMPPPGMPPPDMSGGMPPPSPLGPGAGPGPIAMRRGGRARKASGGGVAQLTNDSGGAGGASGRLRKAANERRAGH